MAAKVNNGIFKPRIGHARHREQELSCKVVLTLVAVLVHITTFSKDKFMIDEYNKHYEENYNFDRRHMYVLRRPIMGSKR